MSFLTRTNAEALMPEDFQKEIVQGVVEQSAVMQLGTKGPNMSRQQRRIPVLSVLPTAYFLNPGPTARDDDSDISSKKLTRQAWENKYLEAEELAVIVPIPESVLDDSDYDIWAEVRPRLLEAFGLAFDQAVFYSTNAPAAWPDGIVTAANSAGNVVNVGDVGDIYDDIMGDSGVISKVENDGFFVNGHVSAISMRGKLRGLRDTNNQPIFKSLAREGMQGATAYELDGETVYFPRNGSVDASQSLLISGDWNQLIYSIRQDITYKLLTEATIKDPVTEDTYNLAQQDMVALRAVMRLAWQVPNPINRLQTDDDARYPFAVYAPAGS